MGAIKTKLI